MARAALVVALIALVVGSVALAEALTRHGGNRHASHTHRGGAAHQHHHHLGRHTHQRTPTTTTM